MAKRGGTEDDKIALKLAMLPQRERERVRAWLEQPEARAAFLAAVAPGARSLDTRANAEDHQVDLDPASLDPADARPPAAEAPRRPRRRKGVKVRTYARKGDAAAPVGSPDGASAAECSCPDCAAEGAARAEYPADEPPERAAFWQGVTEAFAREQARADRERVEARRTATKAEQRRADRGVGLVLHSGEAAGLDVTTWEGVAVRVLVAAKLSLLSWKDTRKDVPGTPDPRGPDPRESLVLAGPIVAVRRPSGAVVAAGRGEAQRTAVHARILAACADLGAAPPAWFTPELCELLVEIVSLDGGGKGQVSALALEHALGEPPSLAAMLKRLAPRAPRRRKPSDDSLPDRRSSQRLERFAAGVAQEEFKDATGRPDDDDDDNSRLRADRLAVLAIVRTLPRGKRGPYGGIV